jgi:positive regulator of sigma E activity
MNDTPKTSAQELWQQQPVEGIRMSVDEIRKRASKFENRLFWRNAREYISGGIAIVLFGYFLTQAHDALSRLAFGLLIAGMAYVLIYLYRKGGSTSAAAAQTGKQCADFFVLELERQRELTSSLWWYLGPLVPGMVMLTVASFLHPRAPQSRWVMAATDVAFVALSYVIIRLNSRAARCLKKQIDELRSAEIQ